MTRPVAAEVSLLPDEDGELQRLEAVIERGLETFVEVGTALVAIRHDKLYRKTYGTFEDYCRERWGMTDRRARQLMSAATAVSSLGSGTIVPITESQVRPLSGLKPEQQQLAWSKAVETAPNGRVTAEHVRSVVDQEFPKAQPNRQPLIDQPGLWPDDDDEREETGATEPDEGEGALDDDPGPDEAAEAIDSALESLAPSVTPTVPQLPALRPVVTPPPTASPRPAPTPAPEPPPDPREKQADAWLKAFHDLFMTVNSVRDLGGLPRLTRNWTPSQRERAVRALSDIRGTLDEYIAFFRGPCHE